MKGFKALQPGDDSESSNGGTLLSLIEGTGIGLRRLTYKELEYLYSNNLI